MLRRRLELQAIFEEIAGKGHVFFQPGSTVRLSYPAILYEREDISIDHADDDSYLQNPRYKVTVIDSDPDSLLVEAVSRLPRCGFSTHFTSDNLNHDVFTIY